MTYDIIIFKNYYYIVVWSDVIWCMTYDIDVQWMYDDDMMMILWYMYYMTYDYMIHDGRLDMELNLPFRVMTCNDRICKRSTLLICSSFSSFSFFSSFSSQYLMMSPQCTQPTIRIQILVAQKPIPSRVLDGLPSSCTKTFCDAPAQVVNRFWSSGKLQVDIICITI